MVLSQDYGYHDYQWLLHIALLLGALMVVPFVNLLIKCSRYREFMQDDFASLEILQTYTNTFSSSKINSLCIINIHMSLHFSPQRNVMYSSYKTDIKSF